MTHCFCASDPISLPVTANGDNRLFLRHCNQSVHCISTLKCWDRELSQNKITWIHPEAFANLTNLQRM